MKIVRNLIKFTLGLPIIILFSIVIIGSFPLLLIVEWLTGDNETETYKLYKDLLIDFWKPLR